MHKTNCMQSIEHISTLEVFIVAYVLKGSCTRRCKLEQDHDGAMVSHLIRYKGVKGTTHQDIFIIISY